MAPPRSSHRLTTAALAVSPLWAPLLAGSVLLAAPVDAQQREGRVRIMGPEVLWTRSADRAVLGVTLGGGSTADTAGVRLEAVDDNGPASKAGLKAGDIVTAINGVSLKVAKEDAEDLALAGLAQRRLQRVLAKAKPGDAVALQVRSGTQSRSVSVTTVSEASLAAASRGEGTMRRLAGAPSPDDDKRGRVGLSITSMGNVRDTLGLFVSSVVSGGPAEKAGIVEGDRIAAVNGVDVRVARVDVEDRQAGSARANRFIREVQKVEPGKEVNLRVFSGGRYREVAVTAVKSSELPGDGYGVMIGDGQFRISIPSLPRIPRGTMAPQQREFPDIRMFRREGGGVRELRIERDGEQPRVIRLSPEVRVRTQASGAAL